METILKCECGSKKFRVEEPYTWSCETDDEGNLDCGGAVSEIDEIVCEKCDVHFEYESFKSVNFC